ncbi:related to transporter protein [Cephalotrichum gorgonifer]|uniref:Related to transporter protein n=1 Tax=Cephalotrichum gorgonifer TaxID=2041049 RepID=A0AAE8MRB3_9PEZI|nr:related to transporter protein [Cephalotrichum gorgonifer]
MTLTKQRSPRNPNDFPTGQLFLLAIVRLAEPIALTSIFPYAWALVKRFEVGNEEDASFYAGLLISSFALAEALTGMYWGGLSDQVGRKPILLLGCFGTIISLIVVGFASNIWIALLGRAFGGLLNGNIGVIQTMVGELVTKPEHEPRAFSVMPFVWTIGTIIGPAIGGTFADPHSAYPDLFPKGSLFDRLPYLLPNLICAGLLLLSVIVGYFLLEETHPDMQPRVLLADDTYVSDETPLMETSDALKRPAVDVRSGAYGTFKSKDPNPTLVIREPHKKEDTVTPQSIFTKPIVALIIALSIFTYHSMTYDHLLPIFFEDEKNPIKSYSAMGMTGSPSLVSTYSSGGLGLSVRSVGMVMAVNGVIALFIQAVIFPIAAERFGIHRLFIIVTVLHPVAYLMVPGLLFVPDSLLYPAIYLCLTVRNLLSIILYPLLLILIKEATPSHKALGRVNGLAASAGAACRMVAPPVAGYLYTVGYKIDCAPIAYFGSAAVATVGAFQCFSVHKPRNVLRDEEARAEAESR